MNKKIGFAPNCIFVWTGQVYKSEESGLFGDEMDPRTSTTIVSSNARVYFFSDRPDFWTYKLDLFIKKWRLELNFTRFGQQEWRISELSVFWESESIQHFVRAPSAIETLIRPHRSCKRCYVV